MRLWDSKHKDFLFWHHRGQRGMTGGPLSALEVKEVDGSPDVTNVTIIRVSNGSLTNDGGGQVTITTGGGGGSLTVKEVDGTPNVSNVTTIRVSNGSLTDDGAGQVTIDTTGGVSLGNSSSFQDFDIAVPPTSPATQDDEFNAGPGLDGKWTQVNWSGLTSFDVNSTKPHALWANLPSSGDDTIRAILQSIPAGDLTIITKIWPSNQTTSTVFSGLILSDGTTPGAGNQILLRINNSGASGLTALATTWTGFNAFGANQGPGTNIALREDAGIIITISRSGTTYNFSYSFDGRTFNTFHSGTLGFTPTHFGLVLSNNTGTAYKYSFDFFRYSGSATAVFGGLVTYGGGLIVSAKATSPYTILNADLNTFFTNEGATARQDFNLPTAVKDLTYSFYVQDVDGVRVVASTGDTIRLAASASASAGRIDSTTIGSSVTLVAINATEWVATSIVGTWTVT